jgi:hypothetical protein
MKKSVLILSLIIILFSLFIAPYALAQYSCLCEGLGTPVSVNNCSECGTYCGNLSPQRAVVNCSRIEDSGQVTLRDPLNLGGDAAELYARIIIALLSFVGIASLVTFIYAGFMFLISAGNPEKVKKAKDTMFYSVLGVVLAIASYAILSFIFKILETSTGQ